MFYDDQVRSMEGKGSAGAGQLDLALFTDGLRVEREEGITIEVACRYFANRRRKFIIADTPGHEQYTCNIFCFCPAKSHAAKGDRGRWCRCS